MALSASAVRVTWDAPAGGAESYIIERRKDLASDPDLIPTGSNLTTFDDTPPNAGDFAYLYRVKAVHAGGPSAYSAYDLATTVTFTDENLQRAVIKAEHLTQLRRAVHAVRTLAGKGAPTWSYPDPISEPASGRRAAYLADVTDLRSQVDEALQALDLALGVQLFLQPYPLNPPLDEHGTVYAAHFEQIRKRVR